MPPASCHGVERRGMTLGGESLHRHTALVQSRRFRNTRCGHDESLHVFHHVAHLNYPFSIIHSQLSILNYPFSIIHSQLSILSILNSPFSIIHSQFSILHSLLVQTAQFNLAVTRL